MHSPLIDDNNPFYCPAIPAAEYIKSLRHCRTQNVVKTSCYFPSVSQGSFNALEHTSPNHDSKSDENPMGSDWILGDKLATGHIWFSSPSASVDELPPYSPLDSTRKNINIRGQNREYLALPILEVSRRGVKRKGSFSDFRAPPKYARSVLSADENSFDVEVRREQLHYSQFDTSPGRSADLSSSLETHENDTVLLINKLDCAMAGIRLKDRLWALKDDTPQALMDFLMHHGYVNRASLEILCRSNITRIEFAPSMLEENGLNIYSKEIYSVLGKENNFRFLTEISFNGIDIRDSDILHINRLPNLAVLLLEETAITNEAVFLLIPLKRILSRLSLAKNPDINDDAVPAILILIELSFLSILGTGIGMVGLRRFADAIHKDDRPVAIEIPFACEDYVDHIHSQYLVNPVAPLITDPEACGQLSAVALKRNLKAHAVCNPSILASGTSREMAQRLSEILKIRKLDVLVMNMLAGCEPAPSETIYLE